MTNEDKPVSAHLEPSETRRIMKNVFVISFAFMLQYTAFSGAANLQSSINAEAGLGTASLAAAGAGLILSNMFLSLTIIKWIGTKWTIALLFMTFMPFIAANLGPTFYTMIPAGLILGVGGGPIWCAQCTYIAVMSEAHSRISKISVDALLVRFFGVFFMIYQMSQVWGNLISSLVLSSEDNAAAVSAVNASTIPELCGASFLPSADAGEALQQQPHVKIEMLVGIYLACIAGAAIIVAVGMDSTKRYETAPPKSGSEPSSFALVVETLKFLREPNQLLLVIITIFIGLEQAYLGADFCAAFVSCAIGTGTVGFVMMTFGLSNAIACVVTGYAAKITGRLPLICFALVLHLALMVTLLVWRPQAQLTWPLYLIAVLWGVCDSIWMVQINAYYGSLFAERKEAAFSNFSLWYSAGYVIDYLNSPYLRTSQQTYLLIAMMTIGVTGYFIVEYRERRVKKGELNEKEVTDAKGSDNFAFQNIE